MKTFSLRPSPHTAYLRLATFAGILAVVIGGVYGVQQVVNERNAANQSGTNSASNTTDESVSSTIKQTTINDENGDWQAIFTRGARTVLMRGPSRTFAEPTSTSVKITTNYWVRILPKPYDGTVDRAWLAKANEQNTKQSLPDIIQAAMQYIAGAKPAKDAKGKVIAGDANYGPLLPNGDRMEGADFNDYLGTAHTYSSTDEVDQPDPQLAGSLSNAGFVRMVWGYRAGIPLSQGSSATGIPRHAHQMLSAAPGIIVDANTNRQLTDFSRMQAGDIVFHNASKADGDRVDHVGIYLGPDSLGNQRFISSRPASNGPTFGDIGGASILNGNGQYARSFLAVRRF